METELWAAVPEHPKFLPVVGEERAKKGRKQHCVVAVEPTNGGRC